MKLVLEIACGYVLGQVMFEILGNVVSWIGKLVVRLVVGVFGIVAEQRRQAAIAAAKAEAAERQKIVRE
ncbi:MAG: hypothetical protein ACRDQZ_19505 [Mycobacteriales bacterium]